ncbi:MAG TPA: ABC transporter substrate-binding protein [Rhizobiaceae bacterium]|nr:ABC transporter substrate-binding protein [Rhizobiaceae bacterium]
MNSIKLSILIAGSLFAATGAFAESGVTDDTITIGATAAATGPIASSCYPVTQAAEAWFAKINERGGIHGRKIAYTVLDDAYSPQRAIGNVRRLVEQDDVFAVFGGCGTATAAAALSYLKTKSEVPYLFPYAGIGELVSPTQPSIFALMPLYDQQLGAILPFAASQMEPKPATAAMISANIAGADAWRAAAKSYFDANGIKLLYDELVEVTSPDRTTFVVQAKSHNPDLLVIVDAAPGAARFLLDMQQQNWKPKMVVGASPMTAEQFLDPVAGAADGLVVAAGFVAPPTADAAKECVDTLAKTHPDVKPSHYSMFGCLGAVVFVEALEKAGRDLTRANLISALESMSGFESGISGPIGFSPDNHLGITSVMPFGVEAGAFKIVGDPVSIK